MFSLIGRSASARISVERLYLFYTKEKLLNTVTANEYISGFQSPGVAILKQLEKNLIYEQFQITEKYSKNDIYLILSVPPAQQKGAWNTGYRFYDGRYYIFCNIGIEGATGHDYDNEWLDNTLKWFAKEGTNYTQPQIQELSNGAYPALLFFREEKKAEYTFAGIGDPIPYKESKNPARIDWTFPDQTKTDHDILRLIDIEPAPVVNIPEGNISPDRKTDQVSRVNRNTKLCQQLKTLHEHRCQICGHRIQLPNDEYYSEAHHIRGLGEPHNGEDVSSNILIVCPNHHAELDYFCRELSLEELRTHPRHEIFFRGN